MQTTFICATYNPEWSRVLRPPPPPPNFHVLPLPYQWGLKYCSLNNKTLTTDVQLLKHCTVILKLEHGIRWTSTDHHVFWIGRKKNKSDFITFRRLQFDSVKGYESQIGEVSTPGNRGGLPPNPLPRLSQLVSTLRVGGGGVGGRRGVRVTPKRWLETNLCTTDWWSRCVRIVFVVFREYYCQFSRSRQKNFCRIPCVDTVWMFAKTQPNISHTKVFWVNVFGVVNKPLPYPFLYVRELFPYSYVTGRIVTGKSLITAC